MLTFRYVGNNVFIEIFLVAQLRHQPVLDEFGCLLASMTVHDGERRVLTLSIQLFFRNKLNIRKTMVSRHLP